MNIMLQHSSSIENHKYKQTTLIQYHKFLNIREQSLQTPHHGTSKDENALHKTSPAYLNIYYLEIQKSTTNPIHHHERHVTVHFTSI